MSRADTDPPPPVSLRHVFVAWWPLAASWLLMGLELPAVNAVIARLPDAKTQLGAYGTLVFPIAIFIEGPIIMILAAATALCKDGPSFDRVRSFMWRAAAALTVVHGIVAFTPVCDFVVLTLLDASEVYLEPTRRGLMMMLPWTAAIAYRRFHQGVLIRFGHSRAVGTGTILRLIATAAGLSFGYSLTGWPGAAVGAAAVSFGVLIEAVYIGFRVRPVVRDQVRTQPVVEEPLDARGFARFYIPLAITPALTILSQPIVSAALSHMPATEDSRAAWSPVYGLVFLLRSIGMSYNEVVVALLGRPGADRALRHATGWLAFGTTSILFAVAFTPLGRFWFGTVIDLGPEVLEVSTEALRLVWFLPAFAAMQSWFQGILVHERRTHGITEGVIAMLIALVAVLAFGILWDEAKGITIALLAYAAGSVANVAWLAFRAIGGARMSARNE